jgi:hypothetical protein
MTFNYGLHDGSDTNATYLEGPPPPSILLSLTHPVLSSYLEGISSIADQLLDTAKLVGTKPARWRATVPLLSPFALLLCPLVLVLMLPPSLLPSMPPLPD